jgi:ElaB/YqjD/DUF883 family membrane-anchored ribosome-binding protein
MAKNNTNKEQHEFVENIKEKATELITDAKEALEITKRKISETLTDENIEEAKKKASKFADETAENLTNFAKEAKEDLREVTQKSKTFFQKIFK